MSALADAPCSEFRHYSQPQHRGVMVGTGASGVTDVLHVGHQCQAVPELKLVIQLGDVFIALHGHKPCPGGIDQSLRAGDSATDAIAAEGEAKAIIRPRCERSAI